MMHYLNKKLNFKKSDHAPLTIILGIEKITIK